MSIFFVLLILATVIILVIHEKGLKFESGDGSNLDIVSVKSWGELYDICSGQTFLSLKENEKKEILDKAITKLQETYQFESYEYNIKQKPLVISIHYSDGYMEAVQLQPFDLIEN